MQFIYFGNVKGKQNSFYLSFGKARRLDAAGLIGKTVLTETQGDNQ